MEPEVAVGAFKVVIELEVKRRDNDKKVNLLFLEMKNMMSALLEYVPRPRAQVSSLMSPPEQITERPSRPRWQGRYHDHRAPRESRQGGRS